MTLRQTPKSWQRSYALYRRRTGYDSLGNETAVYDMTAPDAEGSMDFQRPRNWNTSGHIGPAGAQLTDSGERSGGVLEGYLREELEVGAFDRMTVDGVLYEVRSIHLWPCHRKLLLQRVQ